jgi:Mce-associated membrane protein
VTDTEGREDPVAAPEAERTAPEEPAPAETTPEDEPGPARHGSRPVIVVAAALLIVATFLGVLAARYKAELDRDRDERQQVEQVAARFATAFVTYDYRILDATLERIKRDSTRRYGREFERAFETSLSTLITAAKAQSRGTVTDVFLGSVDDDTASALTVVNVEREGVAGRLPIGGQYLQLDLVKQGGAWRVDNVTSVDLTQPARTTPGTGTPAAPAATTTTSVPK